jgi:mono/diheme cytochrome c family protein
MRKGFLLLLPVFLVFPAFSIRAERAPAKRTASDELSQGQREALHSLILNLEALRATPEDVPEIREKVALHAEVSKKDAEDLKKKVEELRSKIAEAEAQRDKLETRLNALRSARILIEQGLNPPSPDDQADTTPAPSESAPANPEPANADIAYFQEKVLPVLQKNCFECHGPEKQKSGLRLDSREAVLKGGDFGTVVEPGDPDKSFLVQVIRYNGDTKMPPKTKLADEEIEVLVEWVKRGLPWTGAESASTPEQPAPEAEKTSAVTKPWSFEPIRVVSVEAVANGLANRDWIANPIDAFVLAKLEAEGLSPSPEADRRTLIRRAYFNLIGLPPKPDEVKAFVNDPDPNAYEKLVDKLLASPRYGERWGRHWLDVVRFAETNGFETNTPRPNAWPYRDYVIEAFNSDKPYDQFILEQLAGDACGADRATGFLVGGPFDTVSSPDIELTLQQRADQLNDMIATTSTAFLGITVACARCHDHKFDPIAQEHYYRMQALFAGVEHGEREIEPEGYAERVALAEEYKKARAPVLAKLSKYEPLADPEVVFIDDSERLNQDEENPVLTVLVDPSQEIKSYNEGTKRGKLSDPGGDGRLPNFGRSYTHWSDGGIAGKDLLAYDPKVDGKFRLWLSWGGGWTTRAPDVKYSLDRDGDLDTKEDRTLLATVDQRHFSDEKVEEPGYAVWSGFYNAGVHDLLETSRVILTAGSSEASVSADILTLQPVREGETSETGLKPSDHIRFRNRVHPTGATEKFEPVEAEAVRFTVFATNNGIEPCIDELEVFTTDPTPRNVALAIEGATATASSLYPPSEKHKLEHIHDGQYGNSRSWISGEKGKGWVQIDFPIPQTIEKISWARDREGKFSDRTPTRYRIEAKLPSGEWKTVASSRDRRPYTDEAGQEPVFLAAGLPESESRELSRLLAAKSQLDEKIAELERKPRIYAGSFKQPEASYLLYRGDPMQKRDPVQPGAVGGVGSTLVLATDTPERERRIALAKWIVDDANPLTPRVMVNRIWHYHFGRGIVASPSEFGGLGAAPSHPELLDYLATEFRKGGWSVKAVQRLIMLSNTYRQASEPREDALGKDANSRLLWRFPPRRLEAEPIRDAVLAVSGKLDLEMGGPGYDAFKPNDNYVHVYVPKEEWGPEEWRRMVYQFKPRMEQDEVFGVFDCPDASGPTAKRTRSTTPLQALNLLNSTFMVQQAKLFAERVKEEGGETCPEQVACAFELAFNREPDETELSQSMELVKEHGLPMLCRALFNANEFLYLN